MSRPTSGYKFGNKNQWRRWVWKQCRARLKSAPSSALALYLPAEEDLDCQIAQRHGFRRDNLVGIERDETVANRLRAEGRLVIKGDFFESVTAAALGRQVHVVHADLVCGLSRQIMKTALLWTAMPNMRDTVFAFNLMRGRDPDWNELRRAMAAAYIESEQQHRGTALVREVLTRLAATGLRDSVVRNASRTVWDAPALAQTERLHLQINRCVRKLTGNADPIAMSYKSTSGQIFDSVVFRNPLCGLDLAEMPSDVLKAAACEVSKSDLKSATRRNAAVFAHQTMMPDRRRA